MDERKILHEVIPQNEIETLLDSASDLLGVRSDQFDDSIRHNVIKNILQNDPNLAERGVTDIPLAVKRRSNNPDYLTWSACHTILGEHAKNVKLYTETRGPGPHFELHTETRVTRLHYNPLTRKIDGAVLHDLNTNEDILVVAEVWCIY